MCTQLTTPQKNDQKIVLQVSLCLNSYFENHFIKIVAGFFFFFFFANDR